MLARKGARIAETVDARTVRFNRAAALALARKAETVIATRGSAVLRFDLKKAPPDDATLAKAMLGPTGNLKAPTIRIGGVLRVGFNAAEYEKLGE